MKKLTLNSPMNEKAEQYEQYEPYESIVFLCHERSQNERTGKTCDLC